MNPLSQTEIEARVYRLIQPDGKRWSLPEVAAELMLDPDKVYIALFALGIHQQIQVGIYYVEHDPPIEFWRDPISTA